jgi:hypothetical protein
MVAAMKASTAQAKKVAPMPHDAAQNSPAHVGRTFVCPDADHGAGDCMCGRQGNAV